MRKSGLVLAAILAGGCGSNSSHPTSVILFTTTSGPGALTLQPQPSACPTCGAGESQYDQGTTVTVVSLADPGAVLTGWNGACTGVGTCTVRLDGDRTVVAAFVRDTAPLAVQLGGDGLGSVKSDVSGIDCGALCVSEFAKGSAVTLFATPAAGSTFAGWSSGCQGLGACTVVVDRALSVYAIFSRVTASLIVQRTGPGTVYSAPAAIVCGAGCAAQFPLNSTVTLVATPDANATFFGWGGACGGTGSCVVTLDAARSVTAQFVRPQYRVSVTTTGTGAGTVLSSPVGISCGASCVASFDQGSQVVLVASPNSGSMFQGWSGDCTGLNVCLLSVAADRAVFANFVPVPPGLPQNPLPVLFATTPNNTVAGSTGVVLTLTGQNFVAASIGFWAGLPRATQFVDGNTLRMTLLDSDLATGGSTAAISVGTPVPGGGVSGWVTFNVLYPIPTLTSINPTFAIVNAAPFQMTVNGSGFLPTSRVLINSWDRIVTYVSPTQLLASIDANLLASPGVWSVTVVNSPYWGNSTSSSAPLPFEVRAPAPSATSTVPSSAVAGSQDLLVTIYGSSFVNYGYYGSLGTSVVRWNGANLPTAYISGTELRATISAAQLAAPGTGQITVFTSPTGGGTSAPIPFTIQPAPAHVTSLVPDSTTAGGAMATLAIHGQGFTTASTVTWNGTARTANFVDSTHLDITVAPADVSSVGSATIAVSDPSSTVPTAGFGFPILAAPPSPISNVSVAVTAKDLAWDPGRQRIYASVPSTAPLYGNSIVAIDVATNSVVASVRVGSEPGRLSLSDDASKLYVALDGASLVERIDVALLQMELDIPLGQNVSCVDLQAVPGNARAVAISRRQIAYPNSLGITVYDDAVPRPEGTTSPYYYVVTDTIAFAAPDVLYSYNNESTEFGLRRVQILPTGAAPANPTFPFTGFNLDIRHDSGRLYATTGAVADLAGNKIGTFALPSGSNPGVVPDWVHGRVFFISGASLLAFTASSFVPQGSLTLTPASTTGRFVRWGADGIAYRSPTQVVLLRHSLIGG
jgi:YVTN family beta-propeller protein